MNYNKINNNFNINRRLFYNTVLKDKLVHHYKQQF